jgi:nucleoside-diphosphate-sugar epimerase
MTNVLITGGAGFIGSHLARYHLARGDAVVRLPRDAITAAGFRYWRL